MKRFVVFSVLAVLALMAASLPAQAATVIEQYSSPAAFMARLAGARFPVKTVNFDDIATTKTNTVSFSANRYRLMYGMIIKGEGGQYVSRGFRSPGEFVPVSKPNIYAPGPVLWSGPDWTGGNETDVTFYAGGGTILAAGFGCYFIDADWPGDGPASFTVYDALDSALDGTGTVVTANGKSAFRGLVAVDSGTNKPIPAISRVHVVNGSGWLGNDNNEGVALDSFMAGTATYRVTGKVVHSSGAPFKGVRVWLKGGFTLSVTTNALGRYTISNVPPGTYTVMPKKKGFTFRPAKRTAKVVAANLTLMKFRQK